MSFNNGKERTNYVNKSFRINYWRLKVEFYTIKTYGEIEVQHIAMHSSPCHFIKVIRQPHASALSPRSPYA